MAYTNPADNARIWAAYRQRKQQKDIIKTMQAAQTKANTANEARYQEVLGQFSNLGKAGRTRITQQTEQAQAQATQNLTSRGLGNTTITSAVSRGIAGDAELQRQQLDESVAVRKAGVMERKTDAGPDLGMFANLLQQSGQQAPAQSAGSSYDQRVMMAKRTAAEANWRGGR